MKTLPGLTALIGIVLPVLAFNSPQDPLLPACADHRGESIDWGEFAGHSVILYFHKPGLDYSMRGLEQIVAELAASQVVAESTLLAVVAFSDQSLDDVVQCTDRVGLHTLTIADPGRKAFGGFRVIAYPTAYIMDRKRKVVHTSKGFGPNFAFQTVVAARFGAGLIDRPNYDRLMQGDALAEVDPALVRLHRMTQVARRLAAAGDPQGAWRLLEPALQKTSGDTPALELAFRLHLALDRVDPAAAALAEIRAGHPDYALLPLLRCRLALARHDLDLAEQELAGVRPRLFPEAELLRGMLLEARGDFEQAAAVYRTRLEQLLMLGSVAGAEPALGKR